MYPALLCLVCERKDSNLRPLEYQSSALPTELRSQMRMTRTGAERSLRGEVKM